MMNDELKFHVAPVQGHTDAPYRHYHHLLYGGDAFYYTPFIRLEKEGLRKKEKNDLGSSLNDGLHLVPQIIFRDEKELNSLVRLVKDEGYREIDLNMGCPFPLQTARGRGAATVANLSLAEAVVKVVEENPDIKFSVKMRLGMTDPYEWRGLIESLDRVRLRHVAVHPRVARQQYGGDLDMEAFKALKETSANPVVFNGELHAPEDVARVIEEIPGLSGVMLGRGLLGRPSLFAEIEEGREWTREERIGKMLQFHRSLLDYYSENLVGGEHLVLSKVAPFWEYAEEEIGRKAWKAIRKAGNMAKYHSAVAMIEA